MHLTPPPRNRITLWGNTEFHFKVKRNSFLPPPIPQWSYVSFYPLPTENIITFWGKTELGFTPFKKMDLHFEVKVLTPARCFASQRPFLRKSDQKTTLRPSIGRRKSPRENHQALAVNVKDTPCETRSQTWQ